MPASAAQVIDPRSRPYRPRGSALDLFYDRGPEVLLTGPAGTGKSRAILEKIHLLAIKYPGMRVALVRKTRASLTQSTLVTFEKKVLPAGSPIAEGPGRANRKSYEYVNGSEIVVAGLDKPTRLMSTEFDLIAVFEALEITEGDWETLSTRLRNGLRPFQQLLGDTNPDAPRHWIRQRCERGTLRLIESRHQDNPTIWDAEAGDWTPEGKLYIARLDALTGVRYHRLRHGRWVAAEGIVYDGWDRAIHLVDRFPVPIEWRRIVSIDFGYTNPFVCQWWAIDPDGRMYMYRELYMSRRIVADHAAQIRELERAANERIEARVADHDREDRETLHRGGLATIPASKTILAGIQGVQGRLRIAGDGKARLFILRDSLVERDQELVDAHLPWSTEQEIDSYIWAKTNSGRSAGELPLDKDNHGMDALRYAERYASGYYGEGYETEREIMDREIHERKQAQDEWLSPHNDHFFQG